MKHTSIYFQLGLIYIFFFIIAFLFKGHNLNSVMETVLSVSSYLFAILLGFSIINRKERINSIRSLLRSNDATLLSIYETSKLYGDEVTKKIQKLIDDILIKQIDYRLVDIDKSTQELLLLLRFCYSLKTDNSNKDEKLTMMDNCKDLLSNQKEVIYWIKDGMMFFEWISTLVLCSIIIFCIYLLNDGSLVMFITVPFLATTLVLLLFILRDLNNLRWQEGDWIWGRLVDLFKELDLPPYLDVNLFKNSRVNKKLLNLPAEYRLVEYPSKYPKFDDKIITLIKNKDE